MTRRSTTVIVTLCIAAALTGMTGMAEEGAQTALAIDPGPMPPMPPIADAGGPYFVAEGEDFTLEGDGFADPFPIPPSVITNWDWDLDDDGSFDDAFVQRPTHSYPDDGEFSVTLRVTDSNGFTATDPAAVTVLNVPPNITGITLPAGTVSIGQLVTVNASFTDPGVLDTHVASIDWGDGFTATADVSGAAGSWSLQGSHSYERLGSYPVTVVVVDDEGGACGYTTGAIEVEPNRVSARTRYSTAVQIAREGFDTDWLTPGTQWGGIDDVIIASGEDRASADPLAASGLVYAYDAPLFLVSSTEVPAEVEKAVAEIKAGAGGPVTVHIVGGPVSVPRERYIELSQAVGGGLEPHRVSGQNRYELAHMIAREVKAANAGVAPDVVLIANGADPTKFFDALALSPIAANMGYPVLLVSYGSIPDATMSVVDEFDPDLIVIGGGPMTVGTAVKNALAAKAPTQQWYGSNRYTTAIRIADNAVAKVWLARSTVGIAAKLPDACTGGGMVGRLGGVLLITDGSKLTAEVGSWLSAHKSEIERCHVFGGPNSVTDSVKAAIAACLQ